MMVARPSRRVVLAGGLAACGALLALPTFAAPVPVSVVKVVNFSCSVCRASEAQDSAIRQAVQAAGGRFVLATMPLQEGQYARELMYYAAREHSPRLEERVRDSLYRGAQDMGLPFSDMSQVVVWLSQDLATEKVNWAQLGEKAERDEAPRQALIRALRLIASSGAQKLPTYLLVVDGRTAALLDTDTATRTGSLVELRQSVIERIRQLSSRAGTTAARSKP